MTDKTELKQQLEAANQADQEACAKEIEVVLQKYGCGLVAVPGITQDGRIGAQVSIQKAE